MNPTATLEIDAGAAAATQPPGPRAHRRVYLPYLDGIRFLAFLLVFVHHAGTFCPVLAIPVLRSVAAYGFMGVDLFFVLSAFLLTLLGLEEIDEAGRLDVRRFYVRRSLRIWPLYYTVVALSFWIYPHIGHGLLGYAPGTAAHVLQHALLLPALCFYFNVALVRAPRMSTFGELWSISAEEQFYALWPWMLRLVPRRAMAVVCGLALALPVIWLRLAEGHARGDLYYAPLTHLDAFLIGALLAIAYRRGAFARTSARWQASLIVVAVGLMVAAHAAGGRWSAEGVGHSSGLVVDGLAMGGIMAVVLAVPVFQHVLSVDLIRWLGRRTYALYLFHMPAFRVVARAAAELPVSFWNHAGSAGVVVIQSTAALVLTVFIAALTDRWIERPFLRLKDRFAVVPAGVAPRKDRVLHFSAPE